MLSREVAGQGGMGDSAGRRAVEEHRVDCSIVARPIAIRRRVALEAACAVVGFVALGCDRERRIQTCDEASIPAEDAKLRAKLGYVAKAASADRGCELCVQWSPGASRDACGGCKLFAGAVSPLGSCNVFARRG
jgi:hypothetical protein